MINAAPDYSNAQCESCTAIGPCALIDGIVMCSSCQERDRQIKIETSQLPLDASPIETRVVQLSNSLDKDIPVNNRHFHVNECKSIVDIEMQIMNDESIPIEQRQFVTAQYIEHRLREFQKRLFTLKNELSEISQSTITDQRYLNQLVPKLREEERARFRQFDISYTPDTKSATPRGSAPRMSALDRQLESMAKVLGITVEQARASMSAAVKNVTKCTCSETPGLCNQHPKS